MFNVLATQRAIRDDKALSTTEKAFLFAATLRTDNKSCKVRMSLEGLAEDVASSRKSAGRVFDEKNEKVLRYFETVERSRRTVDLWFKAEPEKAVEAPESASDDSDVSEEPESAVEPQKTTQRLVEVPEPKKPAAPRKKTVDDKPVHGSQKSHQETLKEQGQKAMTAKKAEEERRAAAKAAFAAELAKQQEEASDETQSLSKYARVALEQAKDFDLALKFFNDPTRYEGRDDVARAAMARDDADAEIEKALKAEAAGFFAAQEPVEDDDEDIEFEIFDADSKPLEKTTVGAAASNFDQEW